MKRQNTKNRLMLLACIIITVAANAQQTENVKPGNLPQQTATNELQYYTYKVFQAPNKMYGYNILHDGKIIFHQGASPVQSNDFITATSTQEQAEKAALLSIEKMTKNQPPVLSQQELKKIIAYKKS